MPRPRKWRRVCCLPENDRFGPLNGSNQGNDFVIMTVEEFETIRLIDLEGFTQEECADQMYIARTTVQRIYTDARRKLAESLVNGKLLTIKGGDFRLCKGFNKPCGCDERRRKQMCKPQSFEDGHMVEHHCKPHSFEDGQVLEKHCKRHSFENGQVIEQHCKRHSTDESHVVEHQCKRHSPEDVHMPEHQCKRHSCEKETDVEQSPSQNQEMK
ncbi:DUF134 domain-containing protein [Bacillus marasmi]|uniref:DUF134 domain-containing protein n=1 Tax=Bacillus marasmi TaxID=1926279 RepID=UPI0011CC9B24|nr:DUF134 domain-containing protein [Bacillus marasmi]